MRLVCSAMISSRDARSVSSSSGPLPRASSSGFARIDLRLDVLFGARYPFTGNGAGVAAEFGNHHIIDRDAHVIDPRPSGARNFAGHSNQPIAGFARPDEGNIALRRHHAFIVRVTGEGKGRIGKRENETAM